MFWLGAALQPGGARRGDGGETVAGDQQQEEDEEAHRQQQQADQRSLQHHHQQLHTRMDTSWSNFIFQAAAVTQPSQDSLQVDLLPVLNTVAAAQELPPPSITTTVNTAALKQTDVMNSSPPPPNQMQKKSKSKGPYICSLCAKEFKNGYNLRRHEAIHTGIKPTSSSHMKVPTMVPLSLLTVSAAAISNTASPVQLPNSINTTVSTDDGLVTATASGKRIRKNHACEMCGKAFRDVYHLNRHKLSHSDEKPYECPICQQRFKRKDRMSYHVRSHEGGVHKPYVCSHCSKGFSRPDHLNSHVRQVHSTERPFKCQTCEAAFATKDRLRAHMVRHEEKVPCHVCGKLLSAAYITDHMKVHSQGPNHLCDVCSKGFTTAAYLRVHALKHHGLAAPRQDRFICKLCGVHCKTPTQLNGHMQTHTGGMGGREASTPGLLSSATSEAEPLR
ncbi:myc-associated zinc finger protein isoform X2 [Protopterus annectens]|uniref:myc-associated zinc finger protein isoform X2 n=1 Tax=Protopterus annectens TaxID=7888 RepID=UPI001CFA3A87|nr:myc-associated zinc finger protein isoform X2 [Protopterus annectens]